jgi:ppGpp synthetase/RelA/SpoT-type nucleotidyltranferase
VTQKPSFEQYLLTAASALGVDAPVTAERSYTFNLRSAHQSVISGKVMSGIVAALKEMSQHYAGGNSNLLFYPAESIDDLRILQKSFKSVVHKVYRQNVLYNRAYPNAPREGFIEILHLYEKIDDLLRTRLVCKYMDGPKYVCQQLAEHCKSKGIASSFRELSTDAGYYAWHFYFQAPVEIMINNIVEEKAMWVEIQVTTQLAEVIGSLTHGLYEARRSGQLDTQGRDWKWDARSQQFRSAYLGHGLHLLEGIIQTFKDDVLGTQPTQAGGAANRAAEREAARQSTPPVPIDEKRNEEK